MRFLTALFLILTMTATATITALPTPVRAQGVGQAAVNDIPLVVIRYNQKRVYYDKQLYNAVSKALKIKPDAVFSIVSFVPNYSSSRASEKMQKQAAMQRGKLLASFNKMGVPNNRLNVTTEPVTDGRHHEIYIYVD